MKTDLNFILREKINMLLDHLIKIRKYIFCTPSMVCSLRAVLFFFSLLSMSLCFEEDSFLVDVSSYGFYPDALAETLSFQTISPLERLHSSTSKQRTATNFMRPFANRAIKVRKHFVIFF